MLQLIRTTSDNPDFKKLVTLLDQDLKIRDGDEHAFYAQYNRIDSIKHVVVYYDEKVPVGCGAFKPYDEQTAEIKRMFVHPDFRSRGIGKTMLQELEKWAGELHYSSCILETGKKQPEAIHLYRNSGYTLIPNFGQYENAANSVCMKKPIN